MSDDGAYVFFDSADPLVPQATNGTLDVYEWEAQGTGGCALAEGCVSLISSGEDSGPSYFLGASANGSNVFFGTHAKLVPQDGDESGDLYDARIDGGFPTPAGVGPCEGDACQSVAPAPIDATPGSLTFYGPGNPGGESSTTTPPKKTPSTAAQKLATALKGCRKLPAPRRKRCAASARKRYAKQAKRAARTRHPKTTGRAAK